jgi:acyl-CoA hydrolase
MKHTATAYLTFVALDSDGKPRIVPGIDPQTDDERRRFEAAKIRRQARIRLAEELKTQP